MKRVLFVLALVCFFATNAFCYDMSTERVLNTIYNKTSGAINVSPMDSSSSTVTNVRTAVTTNDASLPTLGTGIDTTGSFGIFVYTQSMKLSTVKVTPLYGTTERYYEGDPITITASSDATIVDTYGCNDVNFKVSDITISGTYASDATGVTIDARLLN